MKFRHLFEPIQIGTMTVKNRIALPSMGLMYTYDATMTDKIKNFYYERARGGTGLLITGPYAVDKAGGGPVLVGLDEDRFIPEIKKFNQEVHKIDDVKVAAQIFHSGRYSFSFMTGEQCVSASAIPSRMTGQTPHALTVEEIKELVEKFGAAAGRARESGFDAVEVLACTGYLICQFLSPITNVREDEYGGSFENRTRFILEVIASVRKNVGDDFPVLVRVAGHDYMPESHTNRESAMVCKSLEEAGVNAIDVTGGWHETYVPQLTFAVPSGAYVYLARGIKEAVNIPVLASNRLGNPVKAEKVLREGSADMICMGRPLITDPHLPNKAKEGRLEDIVQCVGCNQVCFDNVFAGQAVGCMLNPLAGHEGEITVSPAEKPRKVVVAGGGPAGMKAAATAAQRGHKVVLMEAEQEMGGQIKLASETPDKGEFAKITASLVHQVTSAGVTVKTGVKATPENVQAEDPDVVIVATGAKPATPPIPGLDNPKVKQAWDIIRGDEEATGKKVVVIGGSATGCETALIVARQGTLDPETVSFLFYHQAEDPELLREKATRGSKEVTIVDMVPRLAENVARTTRWALLKDLKIFNVELMPNTRVTSITDDGVVVEQGEQELLLPADTVILAAGAAPCRELHDKLAESGLEVHLIGDAKEPRKIVEAIHEGFHSALQI